MKHGMIDEKEIEQAFEIFWKLDTAYPGNMKMQQFEAFKAGAKWAIEKMKKESIFSKMSTEKIEEMIERAENEF